jgi:hypothetical protein
VKTRAALILVAAAALLTTLTTGTATAARPAADDPAVIADWNQIAVTTLLGDTTKQLVEDFLYMGFVQAAVHDAVVGGRAATSPTGSTPTRRTAPPPRRRR